MYFDPAAKGTAFLDRHLMARRFRFGRVRKPIRPSFSSSRRTSPIVFCLAVDFLDLRWSGSWSQFFDPPQDFPKQVSGHGDLRELKGDIAAMTYDLGTDLDQLLPRHGQRPVLEVLRQRQCLLRVQPV